ncbi:CpaD family pilus assembly protein [Pyruvatibacter mobilis]|jgi:pilus assembly protein CpaD|uniref:Pilus assembly protein CpaD n=1 Tax=Pyruvatibacter mobilis TaxID=1712261 RepID=A0A845Q8F4_9HYPH|nr:CpaD family pilus assembly protein [Pyruvatibacter mobilis]NBG94935.1 pilus assembly protein CpaD [Pyruvatibacter mobilis]QJD76150.1 CpaD family pilus assembly lipoprotein [Pyruvatibacter mobilis]GGD21604.1 type IV pilus protein [Pyruvatibacter mobilis]
MGLKTLFPLSLAVAAALSVSACANLGQNGPTESYKAQREHPITVDEQAATLMIHVAPDSVSLMDEDIARIDHFAARYKARGNGPMVLSIPDGAPNRGAVSRAVAEVETRLDSHAVGPNRLRLSHYRASGSAHTAPLILSFTQYVATPSPCGNWSEDYAFNPRNTASPNFGCASRNNLAVMVADPGDLVAPRGEDPADVQRRETILERYRQGETTQTERAEEESSAISQVNQN